MQMRQFLSDPSRANRSEVVNLSGVKTDREKYGKSGGISQSILRVCSSYATLKRPRPGHRPVARVMLGPDLLNPWGTRVDQGSLDFFWEIRRRTRSASKAPSNGFLKASLKPRPKSSSPGSSLVRATRIVLMWSGLFRRFWAI